MIFLLLSSIFVCLFTSCSLSQTLVTKDDIFIPFWTSELMDSTKINDFQIIISTPKADITGICILKQINGEWKGTVINEFGLKAFDFVSTPEKCELINVLPFIDKWYIKKVIASDIQFIMEIDNTTYSIGTKSNRQLSQNTLIVTFKKGKELQRLPGGEIKYFNYKYNLIYSLKRDIQ